MSLDPIQLDYRRMAPRKRHRTPFRIFLPVCVTMIAWVLFAELWILWAAWAIFYCFNHHQ
jgi:hypothetical protein